jgi:hypothetical protein
MAQTDKQVICSLFDHRYLPRGLCMIESARRHGFAGEIWVLCLSDECERRLEAMALPAVRTITLAQLESHIPRLMDARANRSTLEYYFTCMAALHTYLFETQPDIDGTMYVDSDILFFANPEIIFDSIGDAPAAVIPHNFTPRMRFLERCGIFNAGWTAFRRTQQGLCCLKWWLDQSLDWCYDRVEDGRYANQAYLDRFPDIAPATRILRQKGFNCAPWNIGNYKMTERNGQLWVDDEPLIFFHFHGIKRRLGLFQIHHSEYGAPVTWLMRNKLYRPYIAKLLHFERQESAASPEGTAAPVTADLRSRSQSDLRRFFGKLVRTPWAAIASVSRIARNLPIVVMGSHVL